MHLGAVTAQSAVEQCYVICRGLKTSFPKQSVSLSLSAIINRGREERENSRGLIKLAFSVLKRCQFDA